MYELSIPITIPSTSKDGTRVESTVNLKDYDPKEVFIAEGFFKLSSGSCMTLPNWVNPDSFYGVRCTYNGTNQTIMITNSIAKYNGTTGYLTIRYCKNN